MLIYDGQNVQNTITRRLLDSIASTTKQFLIMVDDTTAGYAKIGTNSTEFPIGLTQSEVRSTADFLDNNIDLANNGILSCKASTLIQVGDYVCCGTAGKAIPSTSTTTFHIGVALTPASSADEIFLVKWNPMKTGGTN